ncbi:fumarylacetoacetate hydrolase family protein [Tautonia sociabilis]|uniref:FAA hydrolase family protein n=1 Tax=Tautonia sociabilis TaxID=2080755 RepID=A0A432MHP1_9BACT|nr:fumarylacetoacetate hydrolase family protein [Tautonia sociabilis]RUL86870.1 FAA hydrolase family protein [Tautonia sociabilis]
MRLLTVATDQGPRACAEIDGRLVDLNAADPSLPGSVRELIAQGPEGIARAREAAPEGSVRYDLESSRLLAPVPDPRKIICLGLNYRDHAIETGAKIPEEPILFSKYPTALIGHGAPILLPKVCHEVDYEAELVIVVGRPGRDIPADRAMAHVAGFAVGHDVSARDWQLRKPGGQWMAGKTFDTFAPVGPYLVTADEVPDPHALGIRLRLNGRLMQNSNTAQLIFRVPETIAYLSQIMTLEPGDLIFTGTPPGVGMARKPPVWLKPGDVVEVEIDGLGTLRNPIEARP